MKKLNIPLIPVITGVLALAAVIVVIVLFSGAGGDAGLYISDASGSVSITGSDSASTAAGAGEALRQGDIITVGENSSCKITYKSKKNAQDNYIAAAPGTQLVINSDFNGKSDGEIYLNRGSLICNLAGDSKADILIRTADTMFYPADTVSKAAYTTDGFSSYTDVYTFMGSSRIQLYDAQGNAVNGMELLIDKHSGRVTTNELGPEFAYLNIEFPLDELTAFDLKQLITIASLLDDFPYTVEELKAAYDKKNTEPADVTETSGTTVTSEDIQNPEPIVTESTTSPIDIEPPSTAPKPVTTTAAPDTQAPQTTTAAPQTTTAAPQTTEDTGLEDDDTVNSSTCTVVIIVNGEETIQEVEYGGTAEKPSVPEIPGKKFIGWDKSFENITSDTVITAIFEDTASNKVYHTVTLVIADKQTTLQVEDGQAAPIPSTVNIEGYDFLGWDKDFSRVTSDMTVTAVLSPKQTTFTVTFMISGIPYTQTVIRNGTAIPPFTPDTDINGNKFVGWDKSLTNITADTTITAVFGQSEYTVTFMIDGVAYPVKVKSGEDAVPPFTPLMDSQGRSFIGWSGNYLAVSSDVVITAVFG